MLICVVVRDFVAQYEQQLQLALKSTPLVIYTRNGRKYTVYAMCEQARAAGVAVGMTKSKVQGLCPEAQEMDAHHRNYQRQADAICQALLRFTDRIEVEQTSSLTVWLDTGKLSPPDTYKIAGYVQQELVDFFGLCPSVGVTSGRWSSRTVAHITAPGNIRCLLPKNERATLWKLQLSQFTLTDRFPEQCRNLGLKTVGEFARLHWNDVRTCFGEIGSQLHRLVHGYDRHTLQHYQSVQRAEQHFYFDGAVEDQQILQTVIDNLAARLARELNTRGLACTELTLVLQCEDNSRLEIAHTLREPIQRKKWVKHELLRLLDKLSPETGIESLSILLDNLTPAQPQQLDMFGMLFEEDAKTLKAIARRLRKRHPETPIMQFQVLDTPSDVPEGNFVIKAIVAA